MRDRPTRYSGLILLLLGTVLFAGGLYLEWRQIMSRTHRINGPGGTYSLLMPSIHTLPPCPPWLAGLGMLLALCGLVLRALRSGSTGRMGTIRGDSRSNKV